MALGDRVKEALARMVANRAIAAGRLTEEEYQILIAAHTDQTTGAVNFQGLLQILQALVADLPQLLAFITAILPLFGLSLMLAVFFIRSAGHSLMNC